MTRRAEGILKTQSERTKTNRDALERMRDLAREARDAILRADWAALGAAMDEGWQLKRGLADGVTTSEIDARYAAARAAGAYGGKITGAGGGGFLLLLHPPERSHQIAAALSQMQRLSVRITPEGSRILFVGR